MSASTVGSWCLCVSVQNDAFRRWPASLKVWGYPHHQTPVFCLNLWTFIVSSLIWCQRMRTKEQASLGILWNCLRLSQSTSVMGISRLFLHLFVSDGRRLSYYIMQTFFFPNCLLPLAPSWEVWSKAATEKGRAFLPGRELTVLRAKDHSAWSSLSSQGLKWHACWPLDLHSACSSWATARVVLLQIGEIHQTYWIK